MARPRPVHPRLTQVTTSHLQPVIPAKAGIYGTSKHHCNPKPTHRPNRPTTHPRPHPSLRALAKQSIFQPRHKQNAERRVGKRSATHRPNRPTTRPARA
jgi:hypothetical protein